MIRTLIAKHIQRRFNKKLKVLTALIIIFKRLTVG